MQPFKNTRPAIWNEGLGSLNKGRALLRPSYSCGCYRSKEIWPRSPGGWYSQTKSIDAHIYYSTNVLNIIIPFPLFQVVLKDASRFLKLLWIYRRSREGWISYRGKRNKIIYLSRIPISFMKTRFTSLIDGYFIQESQLYSLTRPRNGLFNLASTGITSYEQCIFSCSRNRLSTLCIKLLNWKKADRICKVSIDINLFPS